jgi:hypothetical protein
MCSGLREEASMTANQTTRPPAVRFAVNKADQRRATLTVGGFRVAVVPTGDEVVDLAFSGAGGPDALARLGAQLRDASARWQSDGFVYDALRSRDHEDRGADGDVLARVYASDDLSRVTVTLAPGADPYAESEVEIASMPDGRFALTSEAGGFDAAQMGALGGILEAVGCFGAVGDLLATVRAAARDCGCEDLDDALAEMAEDDNA